jgi:threonine dehydratase
MLRHNTVNESEKAAERIKDVIIRTPLVPLHTYETKQGIYLKPETLQRVTSYKIRGVFNAVASLSKEEREKGLSTLSAGNTAQALGWTAKYFGVYARSYLSERVPESKIEAIKSYGVETVILPFESLRKLLYDKSWEQEPYTFIHPWFNHEFRAGNGTIGLEIVADLPDVDTVYIPVGGGGLMCGVGSIIKQLLPSVRVIGVQPVVSPTLSEAFKIGKGLMMIRGETISDINAPVMDEIYPLLREVVDDIVLVSENEIKKVMKHLILRNKMVVEGAAALSVAAALQEPYEVRGKSVCIISGGSINTDKLVDIIINPNF